MKPYELRAEYTPNKTGTIYEGDVVYAEDFTVYTVSRLGRKVAVEDFRLNSNIVSSSGLMAVTSKKPKLATIVDLKSVPVVSAKIVYNDNCRKDEVQNYEPEIVEQVRFEDGTGKKVKIEDADVEFVVNMKKERIDLEVNGTFDHYNDSFPMTTIESIITKTKASIRKPLKSKNLELVACFNDGTKAKLDNKLVKSETIKEPKIGTNLLKCTYNNEEYVVKVKGYEPDETGVKVDFGKYGTFQLLSTKKYLVPGASRLNSWIGVRYFNNHRETYYSQRKPGFAGGALNIPGRHVAEDGTVRDKDGFICVASDLRYCPRYSVVLTTLGPGKVYDTGCAYGTIDLYVDW